ncbi:hypothetical protein OSTOST_18074, partial [Ostertagia ostertagi]
MTMAEDLVGFIKPFGHSLSRSGDGNSSGGAVRECKELLIQNGFEELSESDRWDTKPNGRYFVTRNRSTIVAFVIGGQFKKGNGFKILATHTDSPCLKVKPISKLRSEGYNQVGAVTYARSLWHTWFDRDLSMAGEIVIRAVLK